MAAQKPLYGIGQHVMLRFPIYPSYNCDHTVIMSMKWVRKGSVVMGAITKTNHDVVHGFYAYEVSKRPGSFVHEQYIRPRPEPGIGWDNLKQSLKQPQPEHCA